jgi:ribokinase
MGKVLVAGSINMDVVVEAARYPKLGETVPGANVFFSPGGKGANQAVAAAKLGAQTLLIGCLGKDAFGRDLKTFLATQGVDLTHVRDAADAPTGTAVITLANGDNAIVVVPGANGLLRPADAATAPVSSGDILVSQFEIPIPTIEAFFERARAAGARAILNPAPALEFDRTLLRLVDILILNESELGRLAKAPLVETDPDARFAEAARSLGLLPEQIVCITLGKRGVLAIAGGEAIAVAGRTVNAIDTTGAGDCFVGAIAAQLARGTSIRSALDYANMAASICVQRMGAGPSMPSSADVEAETR